MQQAQLLWHLTPDIERGLNFWQARIPGAPPASGVDCAFVWLSPLVQKWATDEQIDSWLTFGISEWLHGSEMPVRAGIIEVDVVRIAEIDVRRDVITISLVE